MTTAVRAPHRNLSAAAALVASAVLFGLLVAAPDAQEPLPATDSLCHFGGRITGAGTALPGASVIVRRDGEIQRAPATAVDGTYRLMLPSGVYRVTLDMTGFERAEREIALDGPSCTHEIDVTLVLARPPASAALEPTRGEGQGAPGLDRPRLAEAIAARRGAGGSRFQPLNVAPDLLTPSIDVGAFDQDTDNGPPLLLPPGFGDEAGADAIAITGSAARLDRGLMNDRQQALARGDFSLALSDLAVALGNQEGGFAGGLRGGFLEGAIHERLGQVSQQAGVESIGDLAALFQAGPRGRGAGPGGFVLGGRGGRANRVAVTADYTFGGAALDASPYSLRGETREERPYTRQALGGTIGGPLKIPTFIAVPATA